MPWSSSVDRDSIAVDTDSPDTTRGVQNPSYPLKRSIVSLCHKCIHTSDRSLCPAGSYEHHAVDYNNHKPLRDSFSSDSQVHWHSTVCEPRSWHVKQTSSLLITHPPLQHRLQSLLPCLTTSLIHLPTSATHYFLFAESQKRC